MKAIVTRRGVLQMAALLAAARSPGQPALSADVVGAADACGEVDYMPVSLERVPYPKTVSFTVRYGDKAPITLHGHYWYDAEALSRGTRCPAIVELNPYRRRDGLMYADSMMYPWFAANEYLCFRVDLQGTGDSEGILTDEYTDEELSYCVQVVEQIAQLPICDGNVGMMGKSWSAINSLMVAARDDCPAALKAIIVCAGSDDRYSDDVHYMGGAMMLDNTSRPSDMWGWLALPPDPAVVGERWQEQWRERILDMNFWFEQWGANQTRDRYWSETSVREHYDKVKVPVLVISGWQDGYKNAIDRAVRALGGLGRPVSGLLGPWGHKYPFGGYPGPRIDWLRHAVTHWWDRWLKGKEPDPGTAWPEYVVWLGESREPARVPSYDEAGRWIAEDHAWMERTREIAFHLWPEHRLSVESAPADHEYVSTAEITLGTSALETSSWGECGNDDLPGDTSRDDRRSLHFESQPPTQDLACFGYPTVRLNLECDKPLASLAVRLCEVSPDTGRSHLVTYSFFNLCYRDGDMARPQPVPPHPFAASIPLNIVGHVFRRGWRLRLAISPFYFPTLWPSPEIPKVKLHTGPAGDLPASALLLPGRDRDPRTRGFRRSSSEGARSTWTRSSTCRRCKRCALDRAHGLRSRSRWTGGVEPWCARFSTAAAPSTVARSRICWSTWWSRRTPVSSRMILFPPHPLRLDWRAATGRSERSPPHGVEREIGPGSGPVPVRGVGRDLRERPALRGEARRRHDSPPLVLIVARAGAGRALALLGGWPTGARDQRWSSSRLSRLALPPTAAVLMLTVRSVAKRGR